MNDSTYLKSILDLWPILGAIAVALFWNLRHEAKTMILENQVNSLLNVESNVETKIQRVQKELETDIHYMRKEHDALNEKVSEQFAAVRESLARIEGRLQTKIEKGDS